MPRICPGCGEENPDRFRLCGFCGTPLEAPPVQEVRKVVTVVFSDLKGSTDLGERLDSESLRAVMSRYFDVMRDALASHGGTVEKYIGDAVMAVFGLPTLHEDDALRAVRAAAAMQRGLVALNDELEARWGVRLHNRTGVNTGEVIAGDPTAGQRLVTGDAVNVAARLEQAAPADAVLLGPLTQRLVEEHVETAALEPLELKGKSERVPAFELRALLRRPRRPRHASAPLVGREAEIDALDAALDAALAGETGLATLLGPAGVGKSRLAGEVAARAAERARVLRTRCLPYGRGITFWPLAELVNEAAGIDETVSPALAAERLAALAGDDAVAARVAAAIGLSTEPFPVDELFWGARKLLERLAAARPLVLLIEDLHHAELTFLDLLEHVVASARAPLLIVTTARHDLLELRPGWSQGPHARLISLALLSPADTARIVEGLLGDAPIPSRARARIVEAAEGNPLFAEQLLNMLIDEGLLVRGDAGWTATGDLEALDMPPSLHALLAARLDQLAAEQRAVLEPAAVVGLEFEVAAVRALAAEPAAAAVGTHLPVLSRKQLVMPLEDDEPSYRFHHALIRDAAYGRLLKRARAELHERFATWAADRYRASARGDELDEVLGYHLEQAHRYLAELGPLDGHGRALGANAGRRLAAAGRRAFDREDMPAAANLLRRAAALMDPADPQRVPLLLALGEAYTDIAELALADVVLEQAQAHAGASGDAPGAATAALLRVLARAQGGEGHWSEEIVAAADLAIGPLERSGNAAGAATAWRARAWAHGTTGRFGLVAEAADRAIAHAIAADDDRQHRRASVQYAVAAVYGPTPVAEAIAGCREILERSHGDRRTDGLVRNLLARLVAMDGDVEGARALYRTAQRTLRDAGRSVVAASTSLDSCGVEALAGDFVAAERELRRDFDELTEMGEQYLRSTVAGELVRALVAQGRLDEARTFSVAAESLAAEDDVASQALWRAGRARLLALGGDATAAVGLAREAVDLLAETDAVVTRAEALADLAEVLARAGEGERAAQATTEALAMHERKGNRAAAAGLRQRLAAIAG